MPLDIGIGFLSALGAHAIFHAPLSAKLVLVGVGAALLPDIDILTAIAGNWRHRGLTHYPLTYLPLFAAAFLFAPFSYAALFTFGVLAHLVHDTVGTGWGISWLWALHGSAIPPLSVPAAGGNGRVRGLATAGASGMGASRPPCVDTVHLLPSEPRVGGRIRLPRSGAPHAPYICVVKATDEA